MSRPAASATAGALPIVGHERVRRELAAAVHRDALHHAYLIEGPRGVGKRRIADRLAQVANCTGPLPSADAGAPAPIRWEPCGVCPTCAAIAAGHHPDVVALEPDLDKAARAIPIDAVRELIRKAQYHRYGARHRFVIVDPAEAMLEPAANALLKTLEEPPADTHFLLITHNPRALLPTIRSRCQRVRVGAVPAEVVTAWLRGRGVDPAQAEAATRVALGCPGRAWAMAEGGLAERAELRAELARALDGPLDAVYAFSAAVTQGARQDWASKVDAVLELVEDLARDAALRASGSAVPEVDGAALPDGAQDEVARAVVTRLAGSWPHGITACARAIQDARDDLEVYVSGKTAVDALLTAVRRELR